MEINGFKKLSDQELSEINGGGCVGDCIEAIGSAIRAIWEWLKENVKPLDDGRAGVSVSQDF